MNTVLFLLVVTGPALLVLVSLVRVLCLFSSVRHLFDGGEKAVGSVMSRAALSATSPMVSMMLDLTDMPEGASAVATVRRFLAQTYRNTELVVACGPSGLPADLVLAFDLTETASYDGVTIHRSSRDTGLICMVIAAVGESERRSIAAEAMSGDLIIPLRSSWNFRPGSVADLAAAWVRHPDTVAAFGVLEPRTEGRPGVAGASVRLDLLTLAGVRSDEGAQIALGAIASGYEGCVAGIFSRSFYQKIGGLPGPIAASSTWATIGVLLQNDSGQFKNENRVDFLGVSLGSAPTAGRSAIGDLSQQVLVNPSPGALLGRAVLRVVGVLPRAVLVSVVAAVLGLLTGSIGSDVVWVAATAPMIAVTVAMLGLLMDDRSIRPAQSTSARLALLANTVGASLWGSIGSPLRLSAGELNRA